jgi:hypothetical protein
MVFGPSLFFVLVFPRVMRAAIAAGKRRMPAQQRRIETYRASAESHLFELQEGAKPIAEGHSQVGNGPSCVCGNMCDGAGV